MVQATPRGPPTNRVRLIQPQWARGTVEAELGTTHTIGWAVSVACWANGRGVSAQTEGCAWGGTGPARRPRWTRAIPGDRKHVHRPSYVTSVPSRSSIDPGACEQVDIQEYHHANCSRVLSVCTGQWARLGSLPVNWDAQQSGKGCRSDFGPGIPCDNQHPSDSVSKSCLAVLTEYTKPQLPKTSLRKTPFQAAFMAVLFV